MKILHHFQSLTSFQSYKKAFHFFALIVIFCSFAQPLVCQAQDKAPKKKLKIQAKESKGSVHLLKQTLENIRYEKDQDALLAFGIEEQSKRLLSEVWDTMNDEQKKAFVSDFSVIFGKIAFGKIRSNLKYLEDTIIGESKIVDGITHQPVTLVILHELKKEEIAVDFELKEIGQVWKIVDIKIQNEPSFVQKIRDDQILPILKSDGLDGLLKAIKERAQKLNAK
jgi:phospholipid transport system substrate-binding protein